MRVDLSVAGWYPTTSLASSSSKLAFFLCTLKHCLLIYNAGAWTMCLFMKALYTSTNFGAACCEFSPRSRWWLNNTCVKLAIVNWKATTPKTCRKRPPPKRSSRSSLKLISLMDFCWGQKGNYSFHFARDEKKRCENGNAQIVNSNNAIMSMHLLIEGT